jgi:mandelate racemase
MPGFARRPGADAPAAADRGGTISIAPLALIDLLTEEGVTGTTYLFCYTPLALKPVLQTLASLGPR